MMEPTAAAPEVAAEPKERRKIQFAVESNDPTQLDARQVEMVGATAMCVFVCVISDVHAGPASAMCLCVYVCMCVCAYVCVRIT